MKLLVLFVLIIPPWISPKQYRPDRSPIITLEYCDAEYNRNITFCRVRHGNEVSFERQACEFAAFSEYLGCAQSASP